MKMQLHHYSSTKIDKLLSKEQVVMRKHYAKPTGLWVSVVGEQDWPSMEQSDFRSLHQYSGTLAPKNDVRFIESREQLSEFTKRYRIKPDGERRVAIDWVIPNIRA